MSCSSDPRSTAEIVEKGLPDQVFLTRESAEERVGERPVSARGFGGGGGGGAAAPAAAAVDAAPREARASRALADATCAACSKLLRPYRARAVLTVAALVIGTAAVLAPPALAKVAIDDGSTSTTPRRSCSSSWRSSSRRYSCAS